MLAKKMLRIIAIVLCLVTIFAIAVPVSSDTYAAGKTVSGSSKATKTFYVTTGSKAKGGNYIIIKPVDGVLNCVNRWTHKKSTTKHYGMFVVYVYYQKTGKLAYYTYMNGKQQKLNLKPNTTYKIVVKPRPFSRWGWQLSFLNLWDYTGWKSHATWTVTKQNGIKSCK